ncbi:hypothetical protein HELRODRAFT_158430 [Helobdella robusta]|uniref:protein-tyrosine-phosphatase n=1 Tax=Helobdella robusta TaxID=6412 RepID=T1EMS2_HELRO|nr:hypothetical protein HELRODRAFT_158430 [Helobdella robusta]ESO12027.1 hypothetical protein HELRODRAFT_158430 [Helobdella robusta]
MEMTLTICLLTCGILYKRRIMYILLSCSLPHNVDTHPKFHGLSLFVVENKPLPKEVQMVKRYLHVYCLDSEHFNILRHLNECLEFMDEGISAGDLVLVHCNAGMSRSGSVMIAFLMRQLSLTYLDASVYAKKMRPLISPNPGFVEQLKLFEQMGNVVDDGNDLYRRYCLNLFSEMIISTQNFSSLDEILWAADPVVNHTPVSLFKCKACRRPLFKHSNLIKHNVENSTVKMNNHVSEMSLQARLVLLDR